jgi:hypothetical protein
VRNHPNQSRPRPAAPSVLNPLRRSTHSAVVVNARLRGRDETPAPRPAGAMSFLPTRSARERLVPRWSRRPRKRDRRSRPQGGAKQRKSLEPLDRRPRPPPAPRLRPRDPRVVRSTGRNRKIACQPRPRRLCRACRIRVVCASSISFESLQPAIRPRGAKAQAG